MKDRARKRRGRGEGGVRFHEAKNLWEGTISLGVAAGKRVRRTVYADTKDALLDEMARLRGRPAAAAPRLTVAQLLCDWLEETKGVTRAQTYECRKAVCAAHVVPHLGGAVARELTGLRVQAYYQQLRKAGAGPGSVRHAAVALRAALEYGVRHDLLAANPSRKVKLPPEPAREMVILAPEQARHLLSRTAHLPIHPLLALALGTGMRRGELLGLSWPEADLGERPSVTVRQALTWTRATGHSLAPPKTRAARRTVALPDFAAAALRDLRARRQKAGLLGAAVFCTAGGTFLSFSNVRKSFVAALDWANDPQKGLRNDQRTHPRPQPVIPKGYRFHDLRHTHASILLSSGCSLKAVSARLGHANPSVTLRTYCHVLPGDDLRLAAAMDEAARDGRPT